jgi:hypothetical protein
VKEGEGIRFSPVLQSAVPAPEPEGFPVRPGDCNRDGKVDLSDAVCTLGYRFQGTTKSLPRGQGGADDASNLKLLKFNEDARLDISDAVVDLSFLFTGGSPHFLGTACIELAGCASTCSD